MEQFGNYELVRRIAVGGMGEVYLARQRTAFGREVAVKIIRSDLMHDVVARKRFLREAEVGAYLKHDHILSMVEFGEEQGRLFIVTPYIKGGTLAQRLERGALSLAEVHELFASLMLAVSYLHKRDVIHRDLKPSNILLDKEEDSGRVYVRLIDFGIAAMKGSQMSAPLTVAGEEMGTEAFMAPERVGGSVSVSNDIYSLGIILYLMLTGHLPEDGDDTQPLPQPLERIVVRAAEQNPEDRFANVEEMAQAFEIAYRSLTSSRIPTVAPVPVAAIEEDKTAPTLPLPPAEAQRPLRRIDQERTVLPPSEKYAQRHVMADRISEPMAKVSSDPSLLVPGRPRVQRGRGADSAGRMPAISAAEAVLPPTDVSSTLPAGISPSGISSPGISSSRSELKLPPLPSKGRSFSRADYDAPTSHLLDEKKGMQEKQLADIAIVGSPRKSARKGVRRSLVALITVLIIAVLLAITGIGYLIFVSAVTANVTVMPRVQPVEGVFTMVAKPGAKEMDINASAIPASVVSSTEKGTQQGAATGVSGCVLQIFDCKQTVSFADVNFLSNKIIAGLKPRIEQNLRTQVSAAGGTMVGKVFYPDPNVVADPPPHTVSPTVTVTVTQQGSVEYVKTNDVRSLTMLLLKRNLKQNYEIMDTTMQIGQPVIRSVDQKGNVTIAIAAAGMSKYNLTLSEQANIANQIKGKTRNDALTLVAKNPDLVPGSVEIRIAYGVESMPGTQGQIHFVSLDPTNIPSVRLPTVPSS